MNIYDMKKIFLTLYTILTLPFMFAQDNVYENILNYRLQHSKSFLKVQNEAHIAENNYRQQLLNSYIIMQAGTGNMQFDFTDDGCNYSMSPSASISLPSFANSSFSVSVPFSKTAQSNSLGANFTASFDIYSQAMKMQRLQREAVERSKNDAQEKLRYSRQIVEAELLGDSKEILNAYLEYLQKQLAQVSTAISFRQTELEGYAKTSVKFKAAQLKALAAERQAQTTAKLFKAKLEKFFASCGLDTSSININEAALQDLAEKFFSEFSLSVPEEKPLETKDLQMEQLRQFQLAQENYRSTLEQRKMQNNNFKLSASFGFSHNKTTIDTPFSTSKKSNSVSGGLSFAFPGGSISSGLSFNIDDTKHPSINLAIACNPLEIYYKVLAVENEKLQNELDTIAFENETEKCKQLVSDNKTNAENIQMSFEAAVYEYEIYKQNAADIEKLYHDGYTTKLNNDQAKLEYMQALIQYAQAKANIILFNIETTQAFALPVSESPEQTTMHNTDSGEN